MIDQLNQMEVRKIKHQLLCASFLAVCLLSILQYHCLHYIIFNKNIVIECINIFLCEWNLQKALVDAKNQAFQQI